MFEMEKKSMMYQDSYTDTLGASHTVLAELIMTPGGLFEVL